MLLLKKSSLLAFAPVVGVTIKSEYYRALQVSFALLNKGLRKLKRIVPTCYFLILPDYQADSKGLYLDLS